MVGWPPPRVATRSLAQLMPHSSAPPAARSNAPCRREPPPIYNGSCRPHRLLPGCCCHPVQRLLPQATASFAAQCSGSFRRRMGFAVGAVSPAARSSISSARSFCRTAASPSAWQSGSYRPAPGLQPHGAAAPATRCSGSCRFGAAAPAIQRNGFHPEQ